MLLYLTRNIIKEWCWHKRWNKTNIPAIISYFKTNDYDLPLSGKLRTTSAPYGLDCLVSPPLSVNVLYNSSMYWGGDRWNIRAGIRENPNNFESLFIASEGLEPAVWLCRPAPSVPATWNTRTKAVQNMGRLVAPASLQMWPPNFMLAVRDWWKEKSHHVQK